MANIIDRFTRWMDQSAERQVRRQAHQNGRRSFVSNVGKVLAGATVVPMLPFDRFGEAHAAAPNRGPRADSQNEKSCDYWRYCALSGSLCSCCGGSANTCPPGAEVSRVSWIGTCENPEDGRSYLISYNDCCGKLGCDTGCRCSNHERERPGYRIGLHNGINWCMANDNPAIHCTLAAVVGLADE